ncbi:MAG TPA: pantetheine-phosphate adenylyltransferase [Gemmataceae bacterium]|nr:pantetheine-phosphate adenylyltransferase [Gemmataceae bacterium]
MTLAIYSGSFDPVTFGHLDLIERAARAFADLEVVVGNNPAKHYIFSLDERLRFLRHAIRNPRVRTWKIENQLLADHAFEVGASIIVKGVRGIQDYDYERMMHEINITQQRGIDTHILIARRELNHVSSSAVKELCRYQGLTHEYVPLIVKEALERRLNDQVILGLTGGIGCGKSYLGEQLVEQGRARGLNVHNIDFDRIAHDLLLGRQERVYQELRAQICVRFGLAALDRKALGTIVFSDPEKLTCLNEMMRVPLLTRLRAELAGKKGVLLINAALLAEADLLHLCNKNVILVTAEESVRMERLRGRGLSDEQIWRRLASQYTTEEKRQKIEQRIAEAHWGRCVEVTSNGAFEPGRLAGLLDQMVDNAGAK